MAFSKKGGAEDKPLTILIPIIMGLLFLVIIVGFFANTEIFTVPYWEEVGCWATNSIACGGGAFAWLPTSCVLTIQEDPVDKVELTDMFKDTWWMYHQNECDYGSIKDELALVYSFKMKEDISIEDLFTYMTTYNDGEKVESIVNSDLNEIEKNTEMGVRGR